jgi:hypothetical protein
MAIDPVVDFLNKQIATGCRVVNELFNVFPQLIYQL